MYESAEFGPYLLQAQLGVGGMGVVHRAVDRRVPRIVALKILHPAMATDPLYRERFRRESAMLSAAEHPHIVPLYNTGEIGGRLFLDMRYIQGDDLQTALDRRGAMPARRAVTIVDGLADALDFVHRRGVLHRDIKPRNVMLAGARFFPYLLDFGIARAEEEWSLTQDGTVAGSLDYLAPERFRGEPADARSDLYSLTGVLVACLTGRAPYAPHSSYFGLARAHCDADVPRPSHVHPALAPFDAVVARGMAKRVDARFGSGAELAAAAEQALGEMTSTQDEFAQRWRTETSTASSLAPQTPSAPPRSPAPHVSPPARASTPVAAPVQLSPQMPMPAPLPVGAAVPQWRPTGARSTGGRSGGVTGLPWVTALLPAAAVLAVVGTILPWFRASVNTGTTTSLVPNALTAWGDGKIGVLVPVLLTAAAIWVGYLTARRRRDPLAARQVVAIGAALFAVGLLCVACVVIAWFLLPDNYVIEGESWDTLQVGAFAANYTLDRGTRPGYYLTLTAAILAAVAGALVLVIARARATRARDSTPHAPQTW